MKAFLFCIVLGLLPDLAQAKLQIGRIIKTSGLDFTVNEKKVGVEAPLFWGDRILTGKGTTVEVVIYPSFSMKLHPSTALKIIGSLLEKQGAVTNATSAFKVLKGKIQGQVYKKADEVLKTRIYGNRTISSIRGTTFEIDTEASAETSVYEGEVEVEVPSLSQSFSVDGNHSLELQGAKPELKNFNAAAPTMPSSQELESLWLKDSTAVMASHAKEAKKYKKILDADISLMNKGLKADAKGMFNNVRGIYDQKKKTK